MSVDYRSGPDVPVTPQRELAVPRKLAELYGSLDMLEKALAELEGRLQPVMSPVAIPDGSDKQGHPQEVCMMADSLQGFIRRTESLRKKIDALLLQLEV